MTPLAPLLLAWWDEHGRKDLPWQRQRTPYRVWVSEIMLQQTQVQTVIPYYERFMRRFATVAALAAADLDEVLEHWAGLGYYARARNLWRAAGIVVAQHGARVPETFVELESLPGIGRSTAGAILALSLGQRHAILDGNAKRVLARHRGVAGWPGESAVASALWVHAETETPAERVAAYTQAIMDLGATLCTRARPACTVCPLARECVACRTGKQQAFPGPRPKRARPRRATTVVVVQAPDGAVLLERRPASGIWGGLFSLPELPPESSAAEWCAQSLGVHASAERVLDVIEHAFTHFDLDLKPLVLSLAAAPRVVADRDDRVWHRPGSELKVGVPAPVAVLLESLDAGTAR